MTGAVATPRIGHVEILQALEVLFPSNVFLLARLADPTLSLSGDLSAHVFIPDTHIVPNDDIKRWPGAVLTPSRFAVLAKVLDALDGLRQRDATVTVWQLGDFVDLWRIGENPIKSINRRLKMVSDDWGDVVSRFDRSAELSIQRLFGNHDEDLKQLPGIAERVILPLDPGDHASNDMLVTHGHQYDPIEDLPEALKEHFMRGFTERVTPYTQDLVLSANPHWMPQPDYSFTPPPQPAADNRSAYLCFDLTAHNRVPLEAPAWNLQEVKLCWHPDANPLETEVNRWNKWQDDRHPALWDRAKLRAEDAGGAGYQVALVVVGHTHQPRLIRGRQPDGQPIVLMDCGGWIGPRYLAPGFDGPIHCCTVGVRVGGDLRIYQLGRDAYDWPQ
jgi:UDP-2,3-diacylglucosamine pyrophosphatase LpxH